MMGRRMKAVVVAAVLVAVLVAAQDDKSWTGWAKEKLKQGLGLKHEETVRNTVTLDKDKIEQVITGGQESLGGKEKAYETSNEAYDEANEKAQQAKQTAQDATNKAASMKDTVAKTAHDIKDKAQQYANQASEKTTMIKDKAQQKAQDAAHTAKDSQETVSREAEEAKEKVDKWTDDEEGEHQSGWAKTKAKEGYDAVKKRASKTLHNAKEMAKDMAAPEYDDDEL